MLVPATAEDLKKHGQITITSQTDDQNKKEGGNHQDPLIMEQSEKACVDDGKRETGNLRLKPSTFIYCNLNKFILTFVSPVFVM